jgi:hypothetical protein
MEKIEVFHSCSSACSKRNRYPFCFVFSWTINNRQFIAVGSYDIYVGAINSPVIPLLISVLISRNLVPPCRESLSFSSAAYSRVFSFSLVIAHSTLLFCFQGRRGQKGQGTSNRPPEHCSEDFTASRKENKMHHNLALTIS